MKITEIRQENQSTDTLFLVFDEANGWHEHRAFHRGYGFVDKIVLFKNYQPVVAFRKKL